MVVSSHAAGGPIHGIHGRNVLSERTRCRMQIAIRALPLSIVRCGQLVSRITLRTAAHCENELMSSMTCQYLSTLLLTELT